MTAGRDLVPSEWARLFAPPRPGAGVFPGTVCAAVLTYNRKELLAPCLAALLAQRDPPDRILVLDNGSTDGSEALLRSEGLLEESRIEYVRLERNIGAAGGFAEMFRRVHDGGWDWGWFMDDDVIAAPDALAELKRAFAAHFHHVEEIGFLISNAVSPDGRANCVPAVDERLRDGACAEWSDLLASGLVRIRTSALNSVLIPRGVLATFGIPSPDFQAWGEDTDWSLRVTQTLPAFVVGASRIVHVRGASGELDAATEPDPERIDRFFYLYRNTLYMRRTYWPVQGLVLFLGRAASVAARCLVKAPNRRFRRAWRVLGGTLAGFFFQPRYAPLGKPAEERRDAAAPSRAPRVAAGMRRAFTPPSSGRR